MDCANRFRVRTRRRIAGHVLLGRDLQQMQVVLPLPQQREFLLTRQILIRKQGLRCRKVLGHVDGQLLEGCLIHDWLHSCLRTSMDQHFLASEVPEASRNRKVTGLFIDANFVAFYGD
jgi:hypothetical protein